jgi:CubicO group peptidase (beta-lactamase class C family)
LWRAQDEETSAGLTELKLNTVYNARLSGGLPEMRVLLALLSLIIGLQASAAARADELPVAWPEEVGVDSGSVVRLSAWIRDERLDVRALLLVRDGRLIFERYGQGVTREHNHAVYSVTKSVASVLVGMLIDDGRMAGVDAKVADVLARLDRYGSIRTELAAKETLEVGHVLSMASGLRYAHDPEMHPIYGAPDRLAIALAPDFATAPGARFNYSDGDATIVGALIAAASGRSIDAFARERLFEPLGMRNVEWPWADRQGLHPGGWALRLRAIDMAKFGQLALDRGMWSGRRLVSEAWMTAATTAKVSPNYGYLWWTDALKQEDFWARGYKGQRIGILPRQRAVFVLSAVLPRGQEARSVERMMREFILPALNPGSPSPMAAKRKEALMAELKLAAKTPGEPRNNIGPQDAPRIQPNR